MRSRPQMNHESILASAGSGKTYALTTRYIKLLHFTDDPGRIIALTFTRTAAAEFFTKIVRRLREAAIDPVKARILGTEIELPSATPEDFLSLLRRLVEALPRLNLQTLDSFFYRLVQSFALELGLSGSLSLLDERQSPRLLEDVLNHLLLRPQKDIAWEQFHHAFQQATYGRESRSVRQLLAQFIDDLHSLFLEQPERAFWGDPTTIWPEGCPWLPPRDQPESLRVVIDKLIQHPPNGLKAGQSKAWNTFCTHLEEFPRTRKLDSTFAQRAFAVLPDLLQGSAEIAFGKGSSIQVTGPSAEALAEALIAVVSSFVHLNVQTTQGIHRLLQAFDHIYDEMVRRPGRLAFADLTRLLLPPDTDDEESLERRRLLEYRLDACFDHWLFDEFQDTSRAQWKVVDNLIDEVIQDEGGERSFFYVGDTKQCLYLWREGDDRLFHDLREKYPATDDRGLIPRTLDRSWRSQEEILHLVNLLFSDQPLISETFNPEVARRWAQSWQLHQMGGQPRDSGYAAWIPCPQDDDQTPTDNLITVLQTIRPLERGLTATILVRTNQQVREVTEAIRAGGGPPVSSGSRVFPLLDNQAGLLVRETIRLAAHPGHSQARPFLRLVDQTLPHSPSFPSLAADFRRRFALNGPLTALHWLTKRIAERLPDPAGFYRLRLRQISEAAQAYTDSSTPNLDDFLDFLEKHHHGEAVGDDSIIVQTVHKAKGLEYDLVLYYDTEKTSPQRLDAKPLARRDHQGEIEWILKPWAKIYLEVDPTLRELVAQAENQQAYEALCRLYVALTRARRAIYVVSAQKSPHQGSLGAMIRDALANQVSSCLDPDSKDPTLDLISWENGTRHWYHANPIRPTPAPATPDPVIASPSPVPLSSRPPQLTLVRPSHHQTDPNPGDFFLPPSGGSLFGSSLHAAMESITWWPSPDEEARRKLFAQTPEFLHETLEKTLRDEQILRVLAHPGTPFAEVWSERAFSLVLDNQLIRGVFDRVVLTGSQPEGPPEMAHIIDFKTDALPPEASVAEAAAKHRPQMLNYQTALAAITGLPASAIHLSLVFTSRPTLHSLNP